MKILRGKSKGGGGGGMIFINFQGGGGGRRLWTDDTDCCYRACQATVPAWFSTCLACSGKQSNNKLRYISLSQLSSYLGNTFCSGLPAYHAFTSCDYIASLRRQGQVKPLKSLQKRRDMQNALNLLGTQTDFSDDEMDKIEEYVCLIYSKRNVSSQRCKIAGISAKI